MKTYLVVYDKKACVQVKEFATSDEAYAALDPYLDKPDGDFSGTVMHVMSESDLGVHVGMPFNSTDSDEMDFQGFGDDNS